MPYLFDTDAISEVLRSKPLPAYINWLSSIGRAEQFTSAVVVGELYKGAFRSASTEMHLQNIESRILPALTVLPYDTECARVYGEIEATLAQKRQPLADADLQIAATAIAHGLELVTGNIKHFSRIPILRIHPALFHARTKTQKSTNK